MSKVIEHKGVVGEISNDSVTVRFISKTQCVSCQLNQSCAAADIKEKEVEIPLQNLSHTVNIGEEVDIQLAESVGAKALFLGYLLPFILVFVTLILVYVASHSEGYAGLLALSVLIPYYFILYLLKNKFKKSFSMSIK